MSWYFNRIFGLDKALVWGLSSKILTAISGPITAALIGYYFSPELQGYHYTFLSLTALQIFAELGLTSVVISFASHEWAHLKLDPKIGIGGDAKALSRLSSLTIFSSRWFAIAASLLVLLLIVAGLAFLSRTPTSNTIISWRGPWIALCVATGMNVMLVPAWAILQGCGQIQSFYFCRVVEIPLRTIVMWIAVVMNAGLWAAVIASFASLLWVVYFLWSRYRLFFLSLLHVRTGDQITWTLEILPLQWRIALSWMSGYFMFSLFTPVFFHFQGPALAGQMGMTWALLTGISGLAGTWIQVKIPDFGTLVARKEYHSLDRLVRKAGIISALVMFVGVAVFYGLLILLSRYAPALRQKLLPTTPILFFMIAEVLRQISIAQSSYLRAFKQEPFLALSLALGLSVGGAVVVCAKYFSVEAVSLCYLVAIVVSIFWGTRILVRFRDGVRRQNPPREPSMG
jgi:O-antigen/teichoic acid export membrane protein